MSSSFARDDLLEVAKDPFPASLTKFEMPLLRPEAITFEQVVGFFGILESNNFVDSSSMHFKVEIILLLI